MSILTEWGDRQFWLGVVIFAGAVIVLVLAMVLVIFGSAGLAATAGPFLTGLAPH